MTIVKIPREENTQADMLDRAGSATEQEIMKMKRQVFVQPIPTISGVFDLMQKALEEDPEPEWASDVIEFLKDGKLPDDKVHSRKVRMQSACYTMIAGVVQEGILSSPFEVPLSRRSSLCFERYSRRGLWEPLGWSNASPQGNEGRLLLADHGEGLG
jgi:hypothetical protein